MIGKVFKTVICVLGIGALNSAALGCHTNSDCVAQTSFGEGKRCCHNVVPPRCMDLLMCYLKQTGSSFPTRYPTIPDYNIFTQPNYNKLTLPDYNKLTLPDYNKFTLPVDNIPYFEQPTSNDHDYYGNNGGSHFSPGALVSAVFASIFLSILIFCFRYLRYRRRIVGFRRNFIVRPPTQTGSRTNLVAQGSEQPSRIVIIAIRPDEDGSAVHPNRLPDGEPPFLSEEDIYHNSLHNVSTQEPPPYEEDSTAVGTNLPPKYEDITSTNDQLPPPEYNTGQMTAAAQSINPPQITPAVQQTVSPPPYAEAEAPSNGVDMSH